LLLSGLLFFRAAPTVEASISRYYDYSSSSLTSVCHNIKRVSDALKMAQVLIAGMKIFSITLSTYGLSAYAPTLTWGQATTTPSSIKLPAPVTSKYSTADLNGCKLILIKE